MKTLQGKITQSPVKSWIDESVIDTGINHKSPQIATRLKSTSRQKVNPKVIPHKFLHRVNSSTRLQDEVAETKFLDNQIKKGFCPRWYVVFHLHNPPFGHEDPRFEKNLKIVRDNIFSLIYGSNWSRKTTRARAIFGVELGLKKDRPHVNLLIETLPRAFDIYPLTEHLFNSQLPNRVKCVWKNSAHVQPYYSANLHGYFVKEKNSEFPSINYSISDIIT